MLEAGWPVGMGQRQNPFLQIPLHADYHIGQFGIDHGIGVKSWENWFGRQWDHLIKVNNQLPYNIFAEAVRWEEKHRAKSAAGYRERNQPNIETRKSTGEE